MLEYLNVIDPPHKQEPHGKPKTDRYVNQSESITDMGKLSLHSRLIQSSPSSSLKCFSIIEEEV